MWCHIQVSVILSLIIFSCSYHVLCNVRFNPCVRQCLGQFTNIMQKVSKDRSYESDVHIEIFVNLIASYEGKKISPVVHRPRPGRIIHRPARMIHDCSAQWCRQATRLLYLSLSLSLSFSATHIYIWLQRIPAHSVVLLWGYILLYDSAYYIVI